MSKKRFGAAMRAGLKSGKLAAAVATIPDEPASAAPPPKKASPKSKRRFGAAMRAGLKSGKLAAAVATIPDEPASSPPKKASPLSKRRFGAAMRAGLRSGKLAAAVATIPDDEEKTPDVRPDLRDPRATALRAHQFCARSTTRKEMRRARLTHARHLERLRALRRAKLIWLHENDGRQLRATLDSVERVIRVPLSRQLIYRIAYSHLSDVAVTATLAEEGDVVTSIEGRDARKVRFPMQAGEEGVELRLVKQPSSHLQSVEPQLSPQLSLAAALNLESFGVFFGGSASSAASGATSAEGNDGEGGGETEIEEGGGSTSSKAAAREHNAWRCGVTSVEEVDAPHPQYLAAGYPIALLSAEMELAERAYSSSQPLDVAEWGLKEKVKVASSSSEDEAGQEAAAQGSSNSNDGGSGGVAAAATAAATSGTAVGSEEQAAASLHRSPRDYEQSFLFNIEKEPSWRFLAHMVPPHGRGTSLATLFGTQALHAINSTMRTDGMDGGVVEQRLAQAPRPAGIVLKRMRGLRLQLLGDVGERATRDGDVLIGASIVPQEAAWSARRSPVLCEQVPLERLAGEAWRLPQFAASGREVDPVSVELHFMRTHGNGAARRNALWVALRLQLRYHAQLKQALRRWRRLCLVNLVVVPSDCEARALASETRARLSLDELSALCDDAPYALAMRGDSGAGASFFAGGGAAAHSAVSIERLEKEKMVAEYGADVLELLAAYRMRAGAAPHLTMDVNAAVENLPVKRGAGFWRFTP